MTGKLENWRARVGKELKGKAPEDKYEQYVYGPGTFLVDEGKADGSTPVADDKGVARHDESYGTARAHRALLSTRMGRRQVLFDTNCPDLAPGVVYNIAFHPHPDITEGTDLLVTDLSLEGTPQDEWTVSGRAVFCDVVYKPALKTPKPQISSVQTATVVGPKGQEIHVDEYGRVRVQFVWDREGKFDDFSSCWVRVSQGWAGTGYGMIVIPRAGSARRLPRRRPRHADHRRARLQPDAASAVQTAGSQDTQRVEVEQLDGRRRLQRDHVRRSQTRGAALDAGAEEPAQARQERREHHDRPRSP
jgi:hypothetical protein